MLSKNIAFDSKDPFFIAHAEKEEDSVKLEIQSRQKKSNCPLCHTYSRSIHSIYQREVKDLPAFGNKILITLIARKFYCRNPACPRKIFTERFPEHFAPYLRRTIRLEEKLLKISLLMGGNPGERLCRNLSIQTSSSTLIRLIHRQNPPLANPVTVLGIDDWAGKKRQTYGTALVDLKKHKIVDLLKDREPLSVECWLKSHPEIRVVTRDRYMAYAKGIEAGAPQAAQVVDRWHLLKNLGDALQRVLERNQQQLKHARTDEIRRLKEKWSASQKASVATEENKKQGRLQQAFLRVKELAEKGFSIKATAKDAHICRITVKKYRMLHELPIKRPSKKSSIALFDDYIVGRIKEQPDVQKMILYNELKAKGYKGCRSVTFEYLNRYMKAEPRFHAPNLPDIFYMPSKLRLLLFKGEKDLTKKERRLIAHLCSLSYELKTVRTLSQSFYRMMQQKKSSDLKPWIDKVLNTSIYEIKSFAQGLMHDFEAIKNAFRLKWSNGQVEGQINKLKTVKRQMYGRASFDLLRKRLLLDTS